MRFWITKYALTKGIFELNGRVCSEITEKMVSDNNKFGGIYYGEGREWHRTLKDAVLRAKIMRDSKILSLERQLKRLKLITFG